MRVSNDRLRRKLKSAKRHVGEYPATAYSELLPLSPQIESHWTPPLREAACRKKLSEARDWPIDGYDTSDAALIERVVAFLLRHEHRLSDLSEERGWRVDWYSLLFCASPPGSTAAQVAARAVEPLPYSRKTNAHFRELIHRFPSEWVIQQSFLEHLARAARHIDVVDECESILSRWHDDAPRSWILRALVEAHIAVSKTDAAGLHAEAALHRLYQLRNEGLWSTIDHDELLVEAVEAAMPYDLRAGRAKNVGLIRTALRTLIAAGKGLGRRLGGGETVIPRSEALLESCPRLLRPGQVENYFIRCARIAADFDRSLERLDHLEAGVVAAGLTAGAVYTLSQIDTAVLDAIEFSYSDADESFWSQRQQASQISDLEADSHSGAIQRLQGYVAEQQVALDLAREGHQVEFPESAGQPGWDLVVDGQVVQVKNTLNPQYVQEHLERYPDIPVVVNAEMGVHFQGHPSVWVDESLGYHDIASRTEESVAALDEFADFDDLASIPIIAVAFAAYRNYGDLAHGRVQTQQYAERVAIDAALRTAGGGVGASVGALFGAPLGPVGFVLGGLLGGVIGSIAGGTGGDTINRPVVCKARNRVVVELGDYGEWFNEVLLPPRIDELHCRDGWVAGWVHRIEAAGGAGPLQVGVHLASREAAQRAEDMRHWISVMLKKGDNGRSHAGWIALEQSGAFFHPELRTRVDRVRLALVEYAVATGSESRSVQEAG